MTAVNRSFSIASKGWAVAGLCSALAISFVVYYLGASGPFVLDDLNHLPEVLDYRNNGHGLSEILVSHSGPLGRPISMLSFLLNAATTGAEIAPLKITNIFLHLITGVILFFVLNKLLILIGDDQEYSTSIAVAIVVSAIWLVHPLHVSTVLYTVQRMTELAALFSLLGIACYLKYISTRLDKKPGGFWLILALVCWPLAALSKETGLILPMFFFLIEYFLPASKRRTPSSVTRVFALLFVITGILFTFILADRIIAAYDAREFSIWERLMTQSRVIFNYVAMILFPVKGTMGFLHDGVNISKNLVNPPTTAISMLVLGLLSWLILRLRTVAPLIGLGLAWFFIGHSMESTILPLELKYEHRNYLPSIGLLFTATIIFSRVLTNSRLKIAVSVCVFLACAAATAARATVWASEDTLATQIMTLRPESPRIGTIFARRLAQLERYEDALSVLERHQSYSTELERAYIFCLDKRELSDQTLQHLITELPPVVNITAVSPIIELSNLGLDNECRFSNELFLKLLSGLIVLPISGKYSKDKIMMFKAHFEWLLGDPESAIRTLRDVYNLHRNPIPLFLTVHWLAELNRHAEARMVFLEVKEVVGNSSRNYSNFVADALTALDKAEGRQLESVDLR